ncbi:MAG: EamA family transporter, partial [Flavobacteriales bacterium]|nr:EamA family transporter [Flavobacteriales bacterium]
PTALSNTANSAWQMLTGAVFFLGVSMARGEWAGFDWSAVPAHAWIAEAYLIVFGSIIGFSAYVWLLQVRPATQVSTYAYVNPVVAVLLGTWLGGEVLGIREITGLVVILGGVLLINLAKYRKG